MPLPLLSSTLMLLVPAFAVMMSSLPSPVRSPRRMHSGEVPAPVGVVHRRLEGAVAVAEQHADRARRLVASDDVELAVAVDVADLQRPGVAAGRVAHRGLEGAVAVAEQHADRVGARVLGHEVQLAVAVQVGDAVLGRAGTHRVVHPGQIRQRRAAGHRRHGARVLIEGERVAGDRAAGLRGRAPRERRVDRRVPGGRIRMRGRGEARHGARRAGARAGPPRSPAPSRTVTIVRAIARPVSASEPRSSLPPLERRVGRRPPTTSRSLLLLSDIGPAPRRPHGTSV